MIYVKILAALAVVAFIYFGWSSYNEAIASAAKWEKDAKAAAEAAEGWKVSTLYWQDEKDKADKAIESRDRARVRLQREKEAVYAQLEQARKKDAALDKWASDPLPPFVIEQLRQLAAANAAESGAAVKDPKGARPDNPRPGVEGDDKRRSSGLDNRIALGAFSM